MIGEGQAIGRNQRARSAVVETHRRELQMFQPGIGEFEPVFHLELVFRSGIEEPHAFIAKCVEAKRKGAEKYCDEPGDASLHCHPHRARPDAGWPLRNDNNCVRAICRLAGFQPGSDSLEPNTRIF